VGITDGDTLTILTSINKTAKIRLSEIDTPDRGQPYGNRTKQELSGLTFKKPVAIRLVKIDRYERIVGRIYVEDLDVSTEMVRRNALVKSRLPHKFCRLFYFIDSFRDTLKPAF